MRRFSLITLALAGVLIMASYGIVYANWGEHYGSDRQDVQSYDWSSPMGAEMSNEYSAETLPAPGSFEYQDALETGKLASNPPNTLENSETNKDAAVEEIGVNSFRIGIDTGP